MGDDCPIPPHSKNGHAIPLFQKDISKGPARDGCAFCSADDPVIHAGIPGAGSGSGEAGFRRDWQLLDRISWTRCKMVSSAISKSAMTREKIAIEVSNSPGDHLVGNEPPEDRDIKNVPGPDDEEDPGVYFAAEPDDSSHCNRVIDGNKGRPDLPETGIIEDLPRGRITVNDCFFLFPCLQDGIRVHIDADMGYTTDTGTRARFLPLIAYPMITGCPDLSPFLPVATHWHRPGRTLWKNLLKQTNDAKGWPDEKREGVTAMEIRAITRKPRAGVPREEPEVKRNLRDDEREFPDLHERDSRQDDGPELEPGHDVPDHRRDPEMVEYEADDEGKPESDKDVVENREVHHALTGLMQVASLPAQTGYEYRRSHSAAK